MYQLGVDLGTTWSAAAVCRAGGRAPEPVPLGEHANAVASAVYAGADGSFLLGEAAERRALSDPDRVVREFKRRIGDPTPVLVGREPVPAEALAARFIATLVRQVSQREGGPPSGIAVTHPAGWGPHKVSALRAALAGHGVGPVLLLSEPQAAAVGYAATERVEPGSVVAVYDLGGGTFDAAVVRKDPRGGFSLLGTPEGIERLGGVDFDEAVFNHVREALGPAWAELDGTDPAVLEAVARLRRECTAAKEGLSSDIVVHIPVMLPGLHTRVRLGRAEFEDMIRPAVADTVDALRRALDSAGVAPAALAALLLVGGSSRMPLVT
ncbi:MAG: Hsp70 family protein, partial [Pseudonocardia sp.]|nr:Hsp70 family protein [Pseudonocardia sp.]